MYISYAISLGLYKRELERMYSSLYCLHAADLFNTHLFGTCYVSGKVLIPVGTEEKGTLLSLESTVHKQMGEKSGNYSAVC